MKVASNLKVEAENLMRQLSAIIKGKTMTLILSLGCAYKVAHRLGHILFCIPCPCGKEKMVVEYRRLHLVKRIKWQRGL